jgi:hypothetical protein
VAFIAAECLCTKEVPGRTVKHTGIVLEEVVLDASCAESRRLAGGTVVQASIALAAIKVLAIGTSRHAFGSL